MSERAAIVAPATNWRDLSRWRPQKPNLWGYCDIGLWGLCFQMQLRVGEEIQFFAHINFGPLFGSLEWSIAYFGTLYEAPKPPAAPLQFRPLNLAGDNTPEDAA